MKPLALHDLHAELGAKFAELNGCEVAAHYRDATAEYRAMRESAGLIDLGYRSRLCVLGQDRLRFLHGQVTNDVNRLQVGQGCYAALVSAKGKMVSDLNIYRLQNELLLDFEPGYAAGVSDRLAKYVIADDVEIADVAPLYGMLGVIGPRAAEVCRRVGFPGAEPAREFGVATHASSPWGEVYVAQRARGGLPGFDLFVPADACGAAFGAVSGSVRDAGGRACGRDALEVLRVEFGAPRFGADMDETNLPPEAGLEKAAISYAKGCYIGQEIIARVRTYGQVAKRLRGLDFGEGLEAPPPGRTKLTRDGKDVGYATSAVLSPRFGHWIGLGYVRREAEGTGGEITMDIQGTSIAVRLAKRPFLDPDASFTAA
jgi:folate-binding protein YgfZ